MGKENNIININHRKVASSIYPPRNWSRGKDPGNAENEHFRGFYVSQSSPDKEACMCISVFSYVVLCSVQTYSGMLLLYQNDKLIAASISSHGIIFRILFPAVFLERLPAEKLIISFAAAAHSRTFSGSIPAASASHSSSSGQWMRL